jgi:3-hydroxybutyryl-CoA dehydrogenase
MTKGVSYPKGLLAWGNEIGLDKVAERITELRRANGDDDRYRVSPLLTDMISRGERFYQ